VRVQCALSRSFRAKSIQQGLTAILPSEFEESSSSIITSTVDDILDDTLVDENVLPAKSIKSVPPTWPVNYFPQLREALRISMVQRNLAASRRSGPCLSPRISSDSDHQSRKTMSTEKQSASLPLVLSAIDPVEQWIASPSETWVSSYLACSS
jgi:hypothetical protein